MEEGEGWVQVQIAGSGLALKAVVAYDSPTKSLTVPLRLFLRAGQHRKIVCQGVMAETVLAADGCDVVVFVERYQVKEHLNWAGCCVALIAESVFGSHQHSGCWAGEVA